MSISLTVRELYPFDCSGVKIPPVAGIRCQKTVAGMRVKAEMSCPVGFNVSRRLYSWAFVKRVKSFVHVNISFESNNSTVEIVQGLLRLNVKRGWSVLNVNNTVASNTSIIIQRLYANMYERLDSLNKRSWVEPTWHVKAHLARHLDLKFCYLRFYRRHFCRP